MRRARRHTRLKRRARGTGIGMTSRRAVCGRERAAARLTVRGSAPSGARGAPASEGASPSERRTCVCGDNDSC
jgi:hypothetical protein